MSTNDLPAIPSSLTDEEKKAAERRVAPLLQLLLHATELKDAIAKEVVAVASGTFDAQETFNRLHDAGIAFESAYGVDVKQIERMLARHAVDQSGRSFEYISQKNRAVDNMVVTLRQTRSMKKMRARRGESETPNDVEPRAPGM